MTQAMVTRGGGMGRSGEGAMGETEVRNITALAVAICYELKRTLRSILVFNKRLFFQERHFSCMSCEFAVSDHDAYSRHIITAHVSSVEEVIYMRIM